MKSQLSLDPPGAHHFVRAVSTDGVRIGDRVYTGSLAIAAATLIEDWGPERLEDLEEHHLAAVLELDPEVVLLGTGARQAFLPAARLAPFYRRGVGIELMTTDAACRTFNILAAEGRRVVAALLPMRED